MSWEKQKLLLITLFIAMLAGMAFFLGIAFGASQSKTEFVNTLIPIMSAIGSWVAGIGAIGAVIVALWLAEKQRLSDKEDLEIKFYYGIIPTYSRDPTLVVSVVCKGTKPSSINSISISSENADAVMQLMRFEPGSSSIPTKLGYGESATYLLGSNFDKEIGEYLKKHSSGRATNMKVYVNSTTESFVHAVDKKMLDNFEKIAI